MISGLLIGAATLLVVLLAVAVVFTLWAVGWGATKEERSEPMPGDEYFTDDSRAYLAMTRAITIETPTGSVWPWLAQLGRGAGWYSYDILDNGGKVSARHIVSWIPPPREGDATAIGYLRRIVPGAELTWWVPGTRFMGSWARLVVDIRLAPEGTRSRLVIRMSCDVKGGIPGVALWVFRFIDSIMARRQLLGIKERAERYGAGSSAPDDPETGARDQYQLYEVVYASGERAGGPGKERAEEWRRAAVEAGLPVDATDDGKSGSA